MSTEQEDNKAAHEQDAHDEPAIAEVDRVNVGMIALVTLAIVGVTVAVVIGVQQFFHETYRNEIANKTNSVVDPRLRETAALEVAHFTKYQWADQKNGLVRIPRDRARELVLADYGKLPPYAPGAEASAAPTPAPAAAASASASGSASAAPSGSAPAVPGSAAPAAAASGSASAPLAPPSASPQH